MKEKVLVPAILLAGVSLVVGAAMMAARGDSQTEGSTEAVQEIVVAAPAAVETAASEPAAAPATATEVTEPAATAPGAATPEAVVVESLPPAAEIVEIPTNGASEGVNIPLQPAEPELTEGVSATSDNKITVNLDDVELQQVVKLFTRLADANIMFATTNLRGTVSVHLKDVEWRPALEAILSQQGLALSDSGSGVYSIVPKAEGAPEPLVAATIFLKYAKVSDVKQAIKDSLDPRGKIADFVSRNAIVVRTTRPNMNDITNIVGMIDIPRGQVYIEAKFMELTDTAIKNLGINWQMLQGYQVGGSAKVLDQKEMISSTSRDQGNLAKIDDHTVADSVSGTYKQESDGLVPVTTPTRTVADALNRGIAADKTLSDTSSRDFSNIRTALLNPLSFNLILSALKQESGVSVVSNPRILVANSEAATIHIGEQRTPLVPRTSSIEGSLRTTYEPGAIVDSGVKLTVTPTINTESNITVEIKPEITRILPEGQWTTAPDGSKYPATANKIITTIFSLLSGETAAIGGLTETSDEDTVSKIPLLGDIPLLGKYFFSHQSKTKTQKETIIFVTVGLVSSDRLEENVGLPSGAELVHKRTVIDNEERREFDQKMSALQDAAKQREERSARKRQFLLNRIR